MQIVLGQRVLRVPPATGHALTALDAPCSSGSAPPEVRIRDGHSRGAEVDTHRRHTEGVPHSHVVGHLLHDNVRGRHPRVVFDAEHATGLVVVGREFTSPIRDVGPLRIRKETTPGDVQRVGIHEGSTTHTGTSKDGNVLHHMETLDAEHSEHRSP